MKTTLKYSLLALAVVGATHALSAQNADEPVELPEYAVEGIMSLPTPTHNPVPEISASLTGTSVNLEFRIDEHGRPRGVLLQKPLFAYRDYDRMSFASQMRQMVKNWKFEPARNAAGDPVSIKVIMPVRVIKKGGKTSAVVSLILDSETPDAS